MDDISLGKFISLILRHHPEKVGVTMDQHGFVSVEELILQVNKDKGEVLDFRVLSRIVEDNNKKRYSFNEDKTKIRANQGHSIPVDVQLEERTPPDLLYHGTASKFISSILDNGLLPKNRLYVHLSADEETAISVGKRHGNPVILEINCKKMCEEKHIFYRSVNDVWLTKSVEKEYITVIKQCEE